MDADNLTAIRVHSRYMRKGIPARRVEDPPYHKFPNRPACGLSRGVSSAKHLPPDVNLLDRYIFRSVLFTCLAAVGLFTFIVLIPNILRDTLGYLLSGQMSGLMFAQLMLALLPLALTLALPIGILTGVLLTLGRLSADHEITAMRSVGLSLRRIAMPIFVLAVLCAAIGLYCNLEAMPRARVSYERKFASAVATDPLKLIVPKTFNYNFSNCVLYVNQKDGARVSDVWIWKLDDQKRVKTIIHAESGEVRYEEATFELIAVLNHAIVEDRNQKDPENFTETPYFAALEKTEEARLPLERLFRRPTVRVKPEWLTLQELQTERVRLASLQPSPDNPKDLERLRMKFALILQDKINMALAVFSLAFIAVPLGVKVSRRETSANLGVALILALSYYLLTVAVKTLDRHPEYRPDILIWVPNLLLIGLAVWLFRRIERRK
jgi:lipopolysaccharide export system permease protein